MSEPTFSHQTSEGSSSQLECEGSSCFAPPSLQLTANTLQLQSVETPEAESDTAPAPTALPDDFDSADAIRYNNERELRLDWVRLLQQEMIGTMRSTDGTFDQQTVEALGRWQMGQWPDQTPDGKVGPQTRRRLEETFPSLLTTVLGDHLEPRILVPGDASNEQKYAYYRGIIETAGGVFLSGSMEYNILGIRGIAVADGTDAHQIGAQTLAANTLYQTDSARDYAAARASGGTDDHLSGQHEGMNDMMISLWVDAEGGLQVRERLGNVDPSEDFQTGPNDPDRTGHLRDGQYAYEVGTHGTRSRSHIAALRGIEDPENVLGVHESGGKTRYSALRPTRNQEAWRNSERDDFFISEAEEAHANTQIYRNNRDPNNKTSRYINDNFAMNIHTSRNNRPNSQACMNVPADQYLEFAQEFQASSNRNNILFTLIDASKIENGLQLVNQEDRSE